MFPAAFGVFTNGMPSIATHFACALGENTKRGGKGEERPLKNNVFFKEKNSKKCFVISVSILPF